MKATHANKASGDVGASSTATGGGTSASVLLADVGGTNVRFALADPAAEIPLDSASIRRYQVADFPTFADAARAHLAATGAKPTRGVFAFAGPVRNGEVHVTNHAWSVAHDALLAELRFERLHFVNDFAAMSLCVPLLGPADTHTIGTVSAPPLEALTPRTFALVGPGTGLGIGALLLRDGKVSALETEGGHVSFAPRTDEEIEILKRLTQRFGRVSNERVLSGMGLTNLHQALAEIRGESTAPLAPDEVTRRADESRDATCVRTVELFCELLGDVAGDYVLTFGAWDGAYLAGGIPPRLLRWLDRGGFRRRFEDKGRFSDEMAAVPTQVIVQPDAGLLGAAAFAVADAGHDVLGAHAAASPGSPA